MALFNVVKHANTLEAVVRFKEADSQIWLTVSDEGDGFDASQIGEDQMGGLMNLKHRLNLMGCQMQLTSQPGKGHRS